MNYFLAIGVALAAAISFSKNQHIGWAILHAALAWLYVIYSAIWG